MAHYEAPLGPVDDLGRLERAEPGKALGVDHLVAVLADREQLRVVRRRQQADEVQRCTPEQLVVVLRVLAGVVDERELVLTATVLALAEQVLEAGEELLDQHRELGDVGAVTGIGVRDERDASVGRHDQAEPDDAEVSALLLRTAALGDRGTVVGRGDLGRKVRHVEHEARQVDGEDLDHAGDHPPLDLFEMSLADRVHRVPRAPVVEGVAGQAQPAVTGGLGHLVANAEPGARVGDPVEGRQRDVGAHRRRCVVAAGADHTAATSPKARRRERSGSPGPTSESRVATSSAEPR